MDPFWKTKPLGELTKAEWESLCDGCARCCLIKIEDEGTAGLAYTRVVCRYLQQERCQCTCYEQRTERVPTCHRLNPNNLKDIYFMPRTCAYRMLAEQRALCWWHPLVSGSEDSVHEAGISVRGKVLSEEHVHPEDWEAHVVDWVE